MAIAEEVLAAIDAAGQVPEALRALRNHYALSEHDLEALTGIKRTTVRNKLKGTTSCNTEELAAFAAVFGVPILLLYAGKREAVRWLLDHPEVEDHSPAGSFRIRCSPFGWTRHNVLAAAG